MGALFDIGIITGLGREIDCIINIFISTSFNQVTGCMWGTTSKMYSSTSIMIIIKEKCCCGLKKYRSLDKNRHKGVAITMSPKFVIVRGHLFVMKEMK